MKVVGNIRVRWIPHNFAQFYMKTVYNSKKDAVILTELHDLLKLTTPYSVGNR